MKIWILQTGEPIHIDKAGLMFNWSPEISLEKGLTHCFLYAKERNNP